MSHLKNNVNPNHYKEAGRTRPGDDIVQQEHKQKFTTARSDYGKRAAVKIPKASPDESPAVDSARQVELPPVETDGINP